MHAGEGGQVSVVTMVTVLTVEMKNSPWTPGFGPGPIHANLPSATVSARQPLSAYTSIHEKTLPVEIEKKTTGGVGLFVELHGLGGFVPS
jgi:glutamate formiminotransferase